MSIFVRELNLLVMPPIDAILSLAGGVAGNLFNLGSTIYANKQMRDLAEEQYLRQKKDIAQMNAYNSPAAQVVRLRAAGLSPAMYYGSGHTIEAGSQSTIPQYDRAEVNPLKFDAAQVASMFTDVSRLQNETKRTEMDLKRAALDFQTALEQQPHIIEKAKQEALLAERQVDLTYDQQNLLVSQYHLNNEQLLKISAEVGLTEAQTFRIISLIGPEIRNMDADTLVKMAQADAIPKNVLLAGATLAEMRRHNQATETQAERDSRRNFTVGFGNAVTNRAAVKIKGREFKLNAEKWQTEKDYKGIALAIDALDALVPM